VFCSRSRVAPQSWSTGASGEGGMSTEIARYGARAVFSSFLAGQPSRRPAVPLSGARQCACVGRFVVAVPPAPQGAGSLSHVFSRCCFLVPRYRPGAASLAHPRCRVQFVGFRTRAHPQHGQEATKKHQRTSLEAGMVRSGPRASC
jgi:hypothetical protein